MSDFDPRAHLDELCRRYAVPRDFGRRLLPLALRSLELGDEMRGRILAFLDRSFAAERERLDAQRARRRALRDRLTAARQDPGLAGRAGARSAGAGDAASADGAAHRARPRPPGRPGRPGRDARALRTVAGVLHAWDPPAWLERWAEERRRRDAGNDAGAAE